MAAIQYRGANAVTNFDIGNYVDCLKKKGIHIDLPHQSHHQKTPTSAVDPPKTGAEHDKPGKVQASPNADVMKTKAETGGAVAETKAQGAEPGEAASASGSHVVQIYPEFSPCMESSTIMDHAGDQDHPWNFCMDVDGTYPSLHVSDLLFEKYSDELPDVLGDYKGFDDNIHLIFEVGTERNDQLAARPESVLDSTSCETDPNLSDALERGSGEGGMSPSSTTSSPISSTTTLVSGSYNAWRGLGRFGNGLVGFVQLSSLLRWGGSIC